MGGSGKGKGLRGRECLGRIIFVPGHWLAKLPEVEGMLESDEEKSSQAGSRVLAHSSEANAGHQRRHWQGPWEIRGSGSQSVEATFDSKVLDNHEAGVQRIVNEVTVKTSIGFGEHNEHSPPPSAELECACHATITSWAPRLASNWILQPELVPGEFKLLSG